MQGGIAIVERLSGARAWVALRGSCLLCFMAAASRTLLRVKDGGTVGKLWANTWQAMEKAEAVYQCGVNLNLALLSVPCF